MVKIYGNVFENGNKSLYCGKFVIYYIFMYRFLL